MSHKLWRANAQRGRASAIKRLNPSGGGLVKATGRSTAQCAWSDASDHLRLSAQKDRFQRTGRLDQVGQGIFVKGGVQSIERAR